MKKLILPTLILLTHLLTYAQDRTSGRAFETRSEVLATHGMVCTNNPLATQVGLEILRNGGNAIDAAIAANAYMGAADPGMNGIGGDIFAIVWDARTHKLYGLNGSGRSPENLSLEYFQQHHYTRIPLRGPLSVSVPGCVDGWFMLHDRFGKLPMSQLLAPAISYAREGIPITQETADLMAYTQPMVDTMNIPNFKATYCINNGKFPTKGMIFKNPDLANSLELISKGGRDAYYNGEIAKRIEEHMKEVGGFLTAADLAKHHGEWVDPVSTDYRGYDVWELPPNGQGIAVLEMLNILEGFDLAKYGFGSPEAMHLFIEAKRLAFEDMAKYYGDPDFSKIPVQQLISKEYAAQRRKLIDMNKVGDFGPGMVEQSNTIYLTTADDEGNMVSLIQSNFQLFGSMEVAKGLGFCLQDRGSSFELKKDHPNGFAPGKRPFHTIIPAFVTRDGKPYMSFGVMGGDMQTQGHVQILMNLIDFGMNLQEAGDAPRMNHSGTFPVKGEDNPGILYVESGFPYESIRELMRMGYKVGYTYMNYGGYQAIMLKDGVYYGASDPRKDGQAAGY